MMEYDHDHTHAQNRYAAIPTPDRLGSDPSLTGKGVTIAFVDTGFYPHPDLIYPESRIRAYHDVTDPSAGLFTQDVPEIYRWHGTQTVVSAAGNGYLSGGVYRGLAPEANVVLVKVRGETGSPRDNLLAGLRWIGTNRERQGIRVASISVGAGYEEPTRDTGVDAAIGALVGQGVVVVIAAGNSGCAHQHLPLPPATARSAITVGGYDDHNQMGSREPGLYCSSYGIGPDGVMKPEIIGPAAWVAAPILPGTKLYEQGEALSILASTPDYRLRQAAYQERNRLGIDRELLDGPLDTLRAEVEGRLRQHKIVATHYQHVDGTSFAAPIVGSLVALMLEVNPALDPETVKRILVQSADRIEGQSVARQGFGRINVQRAVELAKRPDTVPVSAQAPPFVAGESITFSLGDPNARTVDLIGDFTGWSPEPLTLRGDGSWTIVRKRPPAGRHRYKFVIDGVRWIPDPGNALVEHDGYGGCNSVVQVATMYDVTEVDSSAVVVSR